MTQKITREQFLDGMARLIRLCLTEYEVFGKEVALPEGYRLKRKKGGLNKPSVGEIVAMLNERRHGTIYNNKWTRHSLKMLLEELEMSGARFDIGHKSYKTKNANLKRSHLAEEYAKEIQQEYLKNVDITKYSMSQLARELNSMGSRTRLGNPWSASACKLLVSKILKQ